MPVKSVTPSRRRQDAEAAAWFYRNSSDGFALVQDGRILSVNPAWCTMTGLPPEAVLGRPARDSVHPEDIDLYPEILAKLDRDGEAGHEHRLVTHDGRTLWARIAIRQVEKGLLMVVTKDITAEHLQQEEAQHTRRIEDLLRLAAKVYPWRLDPETGLFLTDRGALDKNGLSARKEMTPTEMFSKLHPDDRETIERKLEVSAETGRAWTLWYRHARPDGGWACYRSTWRGGRRFKNGRYEVLGLTQDMSELAEARDAALQGERVAKEAAETKSRFLANMSHEIRTPLNGVLGVLHLLKGDGLSPTGAELVDQALACGEMLTQLLNDVLDFSKIEAGKLELSPDPLDAVAALNGVVEMLRAEAEGRGLYLRTAVLGRPGWVSLDPVRLRQILFNLIGNAVKFTLKGGVDIVLTSLGDGADHRLRVEVKDTGVGVAAEALPALFDRFHQVDGSTTRQFGGTGLGLAITRSLVELMGGEVSATSTIGKGSNFWFEIAAPQVESPMQTAIGENSWLEGLRVLVVEDNPTNQLIASRMLGSLGASVDLAVNGAEGVAAAAQAGYDLIFMDIQMPVMDGVEAARRIRKLGGPAAATPIVAMTANVMTHQIREYLAAGMDGAIAKPLNPSAILGELARLASQGDPSVNAVA